MQRIIQYLKTIGFEQDADLPMRWSRGQDCVYLDPEMTKEEFLQHVSEELGISVAYLRKITQNGG